MPRISIRKKRPSGQRIPHCGLRDDMHSLNTYFRQRASYAVNYSRIVTDNISAKKHVTNLLKHQDSSSSTNYTVATRPFCPESRLLTPQKTASTSQDQPRYTQSPQPAVLQAPRPPPPSTSPNPNDQISSSTSQSSGSYFSTVLSEPPASEGADVNTFSATQKNKNMTRERTKKWKGKMWA